MAKLNSSATIPDQPTTERHVYKVIDVPCASHVKDPGYFCFESAGLAEAPHFSTRDIRGVCNDRALRAGMNGRIQLTSLVRFTSKGSDAQRR